MAEGGEEKLSSIVLSAPAWDDRRGGVVSETVHPPPLFACHCYVGRRWGEWHRTVFPLLEASVLAAGLGRTLGAVLRSPPAVVAQAPRSHPRLSVVKASSASTRSTRRRVTRGWRATGSATCTLPPSCIGTCASTTPPWRRAQRGQRVAVGGDVGQVMSGLLSSGEKLRERLAVGGVLPAPQPARADQRALGAPARGGRATARATVSISESVMNR